MAVAVLSSTQQRHMPTSPYRARKLLRAGKAEIFFHQPFTIRLTKRADGEVQPVELCIYIAPNYNITVEEWNTDIDHVHVLFKAHPNSELSKYINAYKSASSRLIKREFPFIRKYLWKEMFWSRSFCLLTTGGVTIDIIRKYIETQGEKV